MSRKVMSAVARTRAQRRELRKEMARIGEIAKQRLREAIEEGLLEGRIEDDGEIVIVAGPFAADGWAFHRAHIGHRLLDDLFNLRVRKVLAGLGALDHFGAGRLGGAFSGNE